MKRVFDVPIYGEISFSVDKEEKGTIVLRWSIDLGEIGQSSYRLIVENDKDGRAFVEEYIDSLTDELAAERAKDLIDRTLENLKISSGDMLQ